MQNWEQLIADKVAMHGVVITCRTDDAKKRNRQNYDRRYDATPKRREKHKAWAQSPAGKKSQAERGKRYRATEKGKESCRRKSRNYFLRHKDDPEWRKHRLEVQKAWKARKKAEKKEIAKMRTNAKVGDTIRIIEMKGEPRYDGKIGVVEHIDDIGQVHGTWGGCAIPPERDTFEILQHA